MTNKDLSYTQNRELSWLSFNQRVLKKAFDDDAPLLEKLKFISIFVSNLDEFFMVRVGSLKDQESIKEITYDNKTNMTPSEQLEKIYEATHPLIKMKDKAFNEVEKV